MPKKKTILWILLIIVVIVDVISVVTGIIPIVGDVTTGVLNFVMEVIELGLIFGLVKK